MTSFDEEMNRQILESMRAGGDDLRTPRPIDYSHAFPDVTSATSFADSLRLRGLRCEIEETRCVPELPWDVMVTIDMAPSLDAISAIEHDLGEIASSRGGRADGWGCIQIVGAAT